MGKTCAIDADSLIYIHSWKNKESNNLDDYLATIDEHIRSIIDESGCDSYLSFITNAPNNIRKKYAIRKEYKGNRKLSSKPKFFYELRNHLVSTWHSAWHPELEADDLCLIAYTLLGRDNTVIASPDKDLRQVPGFFYDYKNNTKLVITEEQAEINLWTQVLTGDSTDNIGGLSGVGSKTAEKIIGDESSREALSRIVLAEYISRLGLQAGIEQFNETFQLVYIRREWPDIDNIEPYSYTPYIEVTDDEF